MRATDEEIREQGKAADPAGMDLCHWSFKAGYRMAESSYCPPYEKQIDALSQQCEKLRQERDELAAHAARLLSVSGLDSDWPEVAKIINETPVISLAEVRSQAIEQFAEQWDFERGGDGEFAVFACKYADRIRKEAP